MRLNERMLLDLDAVAAVQRKLTPGEFGLLFKLLAHQKTGHVILTKIGALAPW